MSQENNEVVTGGDQGADSVDAAIGEYVATAKQLPGVVPELITGKTISEVKASIESSKAAFNRVADAVKTPVSTGNATGQSNVQIGTGASSNLSAASDGEDKAPSYRGAVEKIQAGIEKGKQSR